MNKCKTKQQKKKGKKNEQIDFNQFTLADSEQLSRLVQFSSSGHLSQK